MALTVVASTSITTPTSITIPAAAQVGDLLLVQVACYNSNPTISTAGYTLLQGPQVSATYTEYQKVYYKIVGAGEPGTAINFSNKDTNYAGASIIVIRGQHPTTPIHASNSGTSTAAGAIPSGSLNTTVPTYRFTFFAQMGNSSQPVPTFTGPSGFTSIQTAALSDYHRILASWKTTKDSAGTLSASATTNVAGAATGVVVAVVEHSIPAPTLVGPDHNIAINLFEGDLQTLEKGTDFSWTVSSGTQVSYAFSRRKQEVTNAGGYTNGAWEWWTGSNWSPTETFVTSDVQGVTLTDWPNSSETYQWRVATVTTTGPSEYSEIRRLNPWEWLKSDGTWEANVQNIRSSLVESHSFPPGSFAEGDNYLWKVATSDGPDLGAYSAPASFFAYSGTIPTITPITTDSLSFAYEENTVTLEVSVTDPDAGETIETFFEIYTDLALTQHVSTEPDGQQHAGPVTDGLVSVDVPLEQGFTYYWRARATDGFGYSSWTPTRSFSIAGNTPPTLTKLGPTEAATIPFHYTTIGIPMTVSVEDINIGQTTTVTVEVRKLDDTLVHTGTDTGTSDGTTHLYTVSSFMGENDATYKWRAKVSDEVNESAWTDYSTFYIQELPYQMQYWTGTQWVQVANFGRFN